MKSSMRLDQSSGHVAWRSLTVVAIRAWCMAASADKYFQVSTTVSTCQGHILDFWTLISMAVRVALSRCAALHCTAHYMYDSVALRRGQTR